jgi:hypothetical protein
MPSSHPPYHDWRSAHIFVIAVQVHFTERSLSIPNTCHPKRGCEIFEYKNRFSSISSREFITYREGIRIHSWGQWFVRSFHWELFRPDCICHHRWVRLRVPRKLFKSVPLSKSFLKDSFHFVWSCLGYQLSDDRLRDMPRLQQFIEMYKHLRQVFIYLIIAMAVIMLPIYSLLTGRVLGDSCSRTLYYALSDSTCVLRLYCFASNDW